MPLSTIFQRAIDGFREVVKKYRWLLRMRIKYYVDHIRAYLIMRSLSPIVDPNSDGTRPDFVVFTVPWLCAEHPYDYHQEGFWDFPERAGWMLDMRGMRSPRFQKAWGLDALDAKISCRRRVIPDLEERMAKRPRDSLQFKGFRIDGGDASLADQISFLQAWLFFGIVAEVSAVCGLSLDVEAEVLVDGGDGSRVVSTACLNGLPRRWLAAAVAQGSGDLGRRMKMLGQIYTHVLSMTAGYENPNKPEKQNLTYSECKVMLTISLLLRAVFLTITMAGAWPLVSVGDTILGAGYPLSHWEELKSFAKDECLRSGWCTSECKLLEDMHPSLIFFATHLKRKEMEHSRCDEFKCVADQISEELYHTVHVESGCQCPSVAVDPEDLRAVLETGNVPRILISDECELSVSEDSPFIAISHVWSQGLGNPFENSLPLCQIRRLKGYITELGVECASPAIWIDTLCIPVADNYRAWRNKAIKLMGETYKGAEAVLVLDRELEGINSNISILEQTMTMFFAGWSRRLWTLQEAALAQTLYIQTLCGPHKVENTEIQREISETLIPQILFFAEVETLLRARIPPLSVLRRPTTQRPWPSPTFNHGTLTTTPFQRICSAVRYRTTSKMMDEAIILAIMIGLDTDQITSAGDVDSRMAAFLTMLREMPPDIIFGDWEKIQHEPFQWAPRSLISSGIATLPLSTLGPLAFCDVKGLHGTYRSTIFDEKDGVAGREPEGGRYYVSSEDGELTCCTLAVRGDPASFKLPKRPAFLFPYGAGAIAVVDVKDRQLARDLEGGEGKYEDDAVPYECTIVGYLIYVTCAKTWETAEPPEDVIECSMKGTERRWSISM